MLSLVVPDTSETMTRFSPSKAFTIEDFPAFGRPTIAILIVESSTTSSSISKSSVIISSKSPTPPEPCNADIAIGSPIASE